MAKVFDSSNFTEEVLQHKGLVLVDFWAEWCGPCQILGPIIEEVGTDAGEKVTVGKLNVDESSDITIRYGVLHIPTVILFKDGEPVEQIVGVRKKEDYLELIEKHT